MKGMRPTPAIRARASSILVLAALLAAQPLAAQRRAEGTSREGYHYSARVSPERPAPGDLALVELRLEGVSASSASVAELRLDPGLRLEAESIRPAPGGSSLPRADFRFELRVLEPGALRIESLAIAAEGKSVSLGPLLVSPGPAPALAAGGAAGTGGRAWRWVAPEWAYRYEAFELRLEPLEGGGAGALPDAVFALPEGASLESSGKLSWTVIAFEAGELSLPEAAIGSGPTAGRAKPARLEIRPLPPELKSSRALGRFSLGLEERGAAAAVAGAGLRLRLVLEGRGNLPALALPAPDLRLDGAPLPEASWSSTRVDEFKPEGGSYRGRASLVLDIAPPRAGKLSLSFPPLVALDPGAGLYSLAVPGREIAVGKAAAAAAERRPPISAFTSSAASSAALGAASAAWARGEKGRALALVYGELRRAPPLSREAREARNAAVACSAFLGTGLPLLDFLPPPRYFAIAAFLVALAGLPLFIAARRRGRGLGGARGGILLLALALALAGFGLASSAERRERYAVVWADSLPTVPSARSLLSVSVIKGSTARLSGYAGGYAGLVLEDGVEAWAPLDSLYFY
jgi:hypothetical protein